MREACTPARRWLVLLMLLALLVPVGAGARAAAETADAPLDANASTGDESVSVPTGWWTYTNVTTTAVTNVINTNNARVVDVEPYGDPANNRYTVALVRNAGAYAVPGWWWYVDITFNQVVGFLNTNNARLIDIEAYLDNGVIRFAVAMVSNTGPAARAWSWYAGISYEQIVSHIENSGHRLVDIESYFEGGVKKYAIIAVANTGADAKAWQWWIDQSAAGVANRVSTFGGRIVDFDRQADGTYNIIQVHNSGADNKYWRWYYGLTGLGYANQVATQFGSRIFDVEVYDTGFGPRYNVVMIDNVNAATLRSRSTWGESLVGSNGLPLGQWGTYVKRIGGAPATLLNSARQFEPASAIKAVHNFEAMRRIRAGTDSLASNFVYYNYPNSPYNANTSDACPIASDEVATNRLNSTLNFGKDNMMTISDNRTTRGIVLRYGLPAIQTAANTAGMANTTIDQDRMGCAFLGNRRNLTTLADLGRLYEGVQNGTLLGTGAHRTEFFQPMNGGTFDGGAGTLEAAIVGVVQQEGSALGKSQAQINDFVNRMNWRLKGGSYSIPCSQPLTPCTSGSQEHRSSAGRLSLPTKSGTTYATRTYVFGSYFADFNVGCSGCPNLSAATNAHFNVQKEQFREIIRSALLAFN